MTVKKTAILMAAEQGNIADIFLVCFSALEDRFR